MSLADLLGYLDLTGWTESKIISDHYFRENTKGMVAIDRSTNEAFIVESVGGVPWARISSCEQFESDLAHLQ